MANRIELQDLFNVLDKAKSELMEKVDYHPDDKLTLYYPQVSRVLSAMFQKLKDMPDEKIQDCPVCRGSGELGDYVIVPCDNCKGTGKIKLKLLWVKI